MAKQINSYLTFKGDGPITVSLTKKGQIKVASAEGGSVTFQGDVPLEIEHTGLTHAEFRNREWPSLYPKPEVTG